MRDLIDILLPSVSGTMATMIMASKPLLGFARAEGGGFEVTVVTLEYNLTSRTVLDSLLLVLNFARGLLTLVWWVVTSHQVSFAITPTIPL